MTDPVQHHSSRLQVVTAAFVLSVFAYTAVVVATPVPTPLSLAQGRHLLWIVVVAIAVNLVTLMPVHRAMLAGPRRVFAVSQQPQPLLAAHTAAHLVALARLEANAVIGLALHFLTGASTWFWILGAVAVAGMVALWPTHERVTALLGTAATAGV